MGDLTVNPYEIIIPEVRARSQTAAILQKMEENTPISEKEREYINSFLASIKANGIQDPISAFESPEGLILAHGEGRVRAAIMLNLSSVPVRVIGKGGETDAMMVSLTTSLQTLPDPIALSNTIEKLREKGVTLNEIAARMGKSVSYIGKLASLRKLDEEVRDMVRKGEIGPTAGYIISQIEELEIQRKTARLAKDHRWERDRLERFVKTYLEEREKGIPSSDAYSRTIKSHYGWLRRGVVCDACHTEFPEGEKGILVRLCTDCYKKLYA